CRARGAPGRRRPREPLSGRFRTAGERPEPAVRPPGEDAPGRSDDARGMTEEQPGAQDHDEQPEAQDQQEQPGQSRPWIGSGLAIGVAIGAALGVALRNIGLGIAIGMSIGLALGIALDAQRAAGGADQQQTDAPSDDDGSSEAGSVDDEPAP